MTVATREFTYAPPGAAGSPVPLKERYDNFIGGRWVAPTKGEYIVDRSPATGKAFTEVARSTPEDVELALDAAHAAQGAWGETSPTERARVLNAIADAIDANREMLAVAESWENGKPVRETLAADIPLAADHFRYFAGVIRGEEGSITEIDKETIAYHFREPLGVVGQIIPFNFPLLMAAWKLAPALAGGNVTVVKPASPTPWSILKLAEVIEDIVPAGVINIVNGPGAEVGMALASSKRIAKVAFTGETATGRLIMQYAAQNIIPSTVELGGKSPNIFFDDVLAADDDFLDKAIEGLVLYAFNKGEVCTCPSRALDPGVDLRPVHGASTRADRRDPPGPSPSTSRPRWVRRSPRPSSRRSRSTWRSGCPRAPSCSSAASATSCRASSPRATTSSRPCSRAPTRCASSRRRSSGRCSPSRRSRTRPRRSRSPTTPCTAWEPGSGPGRRARAYRMGRGIKAGRVWTNCYHLYPAGAAFGGYKASGVGRENHKMMLDHYTQTKNLLVSYDPKPLGFF